MQELMTQILSVITVISHFFLIILILNILFGRTHARLFNWLGEYGILLAFLVSLSSMLGSLYYSEIVGFEPCVLCWYQRIFMYALVFILALALYKKKDKTVVPYALLLAFIGGLVAVYHSFLQFTVNNSVTCSIYSEVSCTETYFTNFGYINIPVMSLTAFIFMVTFLLFSKNYD